MLAKKKKMKDWCGSCGSEDTSVAHCLSCVVSAMMELPVKRPRDWEPAEGG